MRDINPYKPTRLLNAAKHFESLILSDDARALQWLAVQRCIAPASVHVPYIMIV